MVCSASFTVKWADLQLTAMHKKFSNMLVLEPWVEQVPTVNDSNYCTEIEPLCVMDALLLLLKSESNTFTLSWFTTLAVLFTLLVCSYYDLLLIALCSCLGHLRSWTPLNLFLFGILFTWCWLNSLGCAFEWHPLFYLVLVCHIGTCF